MLARHGEVVERDVIIRHSPSADLMATQAVSGADFGPLTNHEHYFTWCNFTTVNNGIVVIARGIKQWISFGQHTRAQARLVHHSPTSRAKC